MVILGIETSCDETSAAIIETHGKNNKVKLLSNIISSSLPLHAKTGGIIPEIAAREQVKFIIPVIEKAVEVLKNINEIDAIAVTVGPGLIGSLLVGVETAKTISYVLKKPIIPVNHLFGHIYANWIKTDTDEKIEFPTIALIVSGGHTDLLLIERHGKTKWLGGTRDDAAGEAFDKTGRLLNLPYPGGAEIEKMAKGIIKDIYNFPRPLIDSNDLDFSFSGLKTAVLREVQKTEKIDGKTIKNISYALQEAIFDILTNKTLKAVVKYNAKSIVLGGGVAANNELRQRFELEIRNLKLEIPLFVPEKRLCTDNAAMIAAAGFYNYKEMPWNKVTANPELYFE
jgi:N6-L-threonylcarbamoyladenine synthase